MVGLVGHLDSFLFKFRIMFVGTLTACCLVVAGVLAADVHGSGCFSQVSTAAIPSFDPSFGGAENVNAVTAGMFNEADSLSRSLHSTGMVISCGSQSIATTISHGTAAFAASVSTLHTAATRSGKALVSTNKPAATAMGRQLRSSEIFVVRAASNSASFVARTAGDITLALRHIAPLNMVVSPAGSGTAAPVIDTRGPLPIYAASALPVTKTISQPITAPIAAAAAVQWPLRGAITTEFGVPEPPYQPIHTGIDISDGQHSPIHPFKAGRVIEVIHSGSGLGNHIIVDHDGGITSVYGHLISTAVIVGQQVDLTTTLGYEGSTGASTGTHLHFEIRVNGTPNNPHHFITGRP